MLYFAYGSNMNLGQAAIRMPDAVRLGSATLRGYRVVERQFADVDRAPGRVAHGVLYRIGSRELAALDRYEGFPRFYGRVFAPVEFHGQILEAMLYEMTPAAKAARSGVGYADGYRAACSDGARAAGIPDVFARQK